MGLEPQFSTFRKAVYVKESKALLKVMEKSLTALQFSLFKYLSTLCWIANNALVQLPASLCAY